MKKIYIILITIVVLILLAIAGIIFYLKFIIYPLDKTGMVYKEEVSGNRYDEEEPLDGIEISLEENPS